MKAADLVTTLKGAGPFTLFAPTNAAFAKLPAGTVEGLLKPESKATLSKILTYHVVAGKVMAADLVKMIGEGKGTTSFKTVAGASLSAMLVDGKVVLKDEKGAELDGDDRRRQPVERSHPRRRQRSAAELTPSPPFEGARDKKEKAGWRHPAFLIFDGCGGRI